MNSDLRRPTSRWARTRPGCARRRIPTTSRSRPTTDGDGGDPPRRLDRVVGLILSLIGLILGDEIRDPVFAQPLEVKAILDAAAVGQLVSKAQLTKEEPHVLNLGAGAVRSPADRL